jgi:hypothetical protein
MVDRTERRTAMATITVPRQDVTLEEVCKVLRDGLGDGYNVLPGMGMGQSAIRGPHPAQPDTILVGTGGNRFFKAEIKIVGRAGQTVIRISPGGLVVPRIINSFGIARKTRDVLAASPDLQ